MPLILIVCGCEFIYFCPIGLQKKLQGFKIHSKISLTKRDP